MSDQLHRKQFPNDGIHAPFAWKFPSEPDRLSFTPSEGKPTTSAELTSDDLNRFALQTDDDSVWFLKSISPVTWVQVNPTSTFSGSIVGGGDFAATYLVLSATSSLANERVFSISGSAGLRTIDNGPGATFALALDNAIVATLSGSTFAQLSGSLQQVSAGVPYLLAQGSITITTMSNGQVIISGSSAGTTTNVSGGDPAPSYLVLSTTASLSGERVLNVSGASGLRAVDTGPNGTLTLSVNDSVVATISGSTFTGAIIASGGLSGSLQKTTSGLSYLVGVGGISIVSQSNGQILISGSSTSQSQVTAGVGIVVSGSQVSINDNLVATLSGSTFTGPVVAGSGLSGSLQRTSAGLPYLLSQGGITITTQSNGQVIISGSTGGGGAAPSQGTGIIVVGSQVSINDNVVATLSGSTFTGQLVASGGLTGSLQKTLAGLSYLVGVGAVSVTSQSNGQIFISGSGDTTAAGLGLTKTGATLAIDNAVVATLSGSTFSGPVNAQAGLTGSIQQVAPGVSYLVGVGSVFITSQSNGQIIISGSGGGGGGAPPVGGTGILITGGNIVNIDPSVVAQLSDATFTKLSGSLQRLASGQTYLAAAGAVTVVTSSTGQVIVSASAGVTPQSGNGVNVSGLGVVSVNDSVVATLSGSTFSGPVITQGGLSGSLQKTSGGLSYLVGVGGTTIISQSNGQILVSSSAPQVPVAGLGINVTGSTINIDPSVVAQLSNATFVKLSGSLQRLATGETFIAGAGVVSVTTSSNGQVVVSGSSLPPVAGQGVLVNDRTVSIDPTIVATLSGSTFVQLSGSLQRTSAGLSYLVAGQNVTVTSQSNGQVVIASSFTSAADVSASYVTIGNTGSLPNERSLVVGTGLSLVDGGAGNTVSLSVNNNVVATLSGSTFTGPVSASAGLSGSLQQVAPGLPYLLAQGSITLTTMSNGQILISGSAGGSSPVAGSGILVAGSTVSIDPAVVATLSGSTFTQLSGSLQKTAAGLSYLVAGQNVTIVSQSNGQVVIASTATGGASSVWIDGGNKLKTTSSVSISSDNNYVDTIGTDTFFYVSGTVGGTTRKVSVFGGDAVFSGSVKVGSGSVTITSNNVQFTDAATRIERSGSHLRFYDVNNPTGLTLTALGAGGSGGGSGDPDATYLVVSLTGSLNNERSLAGSSGIILTDGGPNSTFTISINDNVVATLSGSRFTGPVTAAGGLSGSLQRLATGETAFAGVGGTSITTQSNGQVVISSSAPTAYLPGQGINLGGQTFSADFNLIVARSGSSMSGPLVLSGGLTGSLQKTIDGSSYLVGVGGISITSQSNGQILISSSVPQGVTAGTGVIVSGQQISVDPNLVAMRSGSSFQRLSASIQQTDTGLSYLVGAGNVSIVSQSNGQIVISGSSVPPTAGSGITVSGFQVSVDPNVVVMRSGSSVTGPLTLLGGVSGSLQRLSTGETYIAGVGGVTVTTGSNGQVQISGSSPVPPSAGTGVIVSSFQVSIDPNVVVMRSGSSMTGPLVLSGGLTGSLQQTISGLSYLVGVGGVSITSQSNGQIFVSSSNDTTVAGTGLTKTNNAISINDSVVATVSGTTFTGVVNAPFVSGSLQRLTTGETYIAGFGTTSVVTGSNGQVQISSYGIQAGPSGSVNPAHLVDRWYVDIVSGSDLNNGTSPSTPLRTAERLSQILCPEGTLYFPRQTTVLYFAPGTYDTLSLNATFQPPNTLTILGTVSSSNPMTLSEVTASNSSTPTRGMIASTTSSFVASRRIRVISGAASGSVTYSTGLGADSQHTWVKPFYRESDASLTFPSIGDQVVVEQTLTKISKIGVNSNLVGLGPSAIGLASFVVKDVSTNDHTGGSVLPQGLGITFSQCELTGTSSTSLSAITFNNCRTIAGTGSKTLIGQFFLFNGCSFQAGLSFTGNSVARFGPACAIDAAFISMNHPSITTQTGQASVKLLNDFEMCNGSGQTGFYVGHGCQLVANAKVWGSGSSNTFATGINFTGGGNAVVAAAANLTFPVTTPVVAAGQNVTGSFSSIIPFRFPLANCGIALTSDPTAKRYINASDITNDSATVSGSTVSNALDNLKAALSDVSASYVTIGNTGSLPNERSLSVGSGLTLTDGGAGSTVTIGVNNSIVATLSGSTFAQLSGSLQQIAPGLPYLLSQGSITITTQSNGQVIISGSGGSGGSNPVAGAGILVAGSTISIDPAVVATLSGSTFVQLSGSLQRTTTGLSYLVAGQNVTIASQSNGQVVIASSFTSAADVSASYVTIGNTGSLPNERSLAVSADLSLADGGSGASVTIGLSPINSFKLTQVPDVSASYITIGNTGSLPNERSLAVSAGLTLTDGGAGGTVSLGINDNVLATLTGSTFSGPVIAGGGLSGSLQRTSAGLPYLLSQGGITLITQSNGQIIISGASGGSGGSNPVAGTGIVVAGSTISIDQSVVATLSGSTFTQLSGSLQRTSAGLSYLVGAGALTVTSQSNGQVILSSSLFDANSHASLRQLIHLAENGPYELIGSGSTLDIGPQPFPTASIWRTAGGSKIVEKLWTRNPNKTPATITWKVYAPDGSTVLSQAQDTITYQGVFEISRTRTVI